ncbi:GtrA family protein [Flammeovirga pectinis]|uniref:GtrA family protein n=1 Tax=Flammeovirga pectinis TaxID=2494373 RepID=A0A3Q9FRU4_9BACT|nr:GtrA family protein [Flammeovirga pectinis]AZQ64931.1 GtrA family protein [Flammeovirga pectinis]
MRNFLIKLIDFFYPPFKKVMPLQTFRYAVCGGGNLALDIILYFLVFHFVVDEHNLDLGFVVISGHIAALFIVFPITFTTGFLLQKYITFQLSDVKSHIQLFRYAQVSAGAIVLNYLLMKFFVDLLHIYPTPSKMLTTVVSVIFSYISQSRYTFKVNTKKNK